MENSSCFSRDATMKTTTTTGEAKRIFGSVEIAKEGKMMLVKKALLPFISPLTSQTNTSSFHYALNVRVAFILSSIKFCAHLR